MVFLDFFFFFAYKWQVKSELTYPSDTLPHPQHSLGDSSSPRLGIILLLSIPISLSPIQATLLNNSLIYPSWIFKRLFKLYMLNIMLWFFLLNLLLPYSSSSHQIATPSLLQLLGLVAWNYSLPFHLHFKFNLSANPDGFYLLTTATITFDYFLLPPLQCPVSNHQHLSSKFLESNWSLCFHLFL